VDTNRKKIAWGFKFGKLEHKARYFAMKLLVVGLIIMAFGFYYDCEIFKQIGAAGVFGCFVVELVSLGFHAQEKKFMNEFRHSKIYGNHSRG
jgi:hypothetical protein